VLHGLYQGKRASGGASGVSRWFSWNRVIWARFSLSRGPRIILMFLQGALGWVCLSRLVVFGR
jgi:hypothetical protein